MWPGGCVPASELALVLNRGPGPDGMATPGAGLPADEAPEAPAVLDEVARPAKADGGEGAASADGYGGSTHERVLPATRSSGLTPRSPRTEHRSPGHP